MVQFIFVSNATDAWSCSVHTYDGHPRHEFAAYYNHKVRLQPYTPSYMLMMTSTIIHFIIPRWPKPDETTQNKAHIECHRFRPLFHPFPLSHTIWMSSRANKGSECTIDIHVDKDMHCWPDVTRCLSVVLVRIQGHLIKMVTAWLTTEWMLTRPCLDQPWPTTVSTDALLSHLGNLYTILYLIDPWSFHD